MPRTRISLDSVAPQLLTVVDQIVVSGTAFATAMLVGRVAGAEGLGAYALAATVVILAGHLQESLVSLPYTVRGSHRDDRSRRIAARVALLHHRVIAGLSLIALVLAAAALWLQGSRTPTIAVVVVLAGAIPFILLRDFARRIAFAHLTMGEALLLDVAVAAIQLMGIALLIGGGMLTAATAYLAIGVATGVSGVSWMRRSRLRFSPSWSTARRAVRAHWQFGRWVAASRLSEMAASEHLLLWVLALMHDPAAAGLFAGCMTVVQLSNPFVLGVAHALTPRAAHAYARDGSRGAQRVVWTTSLWATSVMLLFAGVVWLVGARLLTLIYGPSFSAGAPFAFILALYATLSTASLGAHEALCAIERPDLTFALQPIGLAVVVPAAWWLVPAGGVAGAAYALLLAQAVESVASVLLFIRMTRPGMPVRPARSWRFAVGDLETA